MISLQGGNTGSVDAGGYDVLTGTEGGNITVECTFTFSGGRRFFCKQECEEGVLVQTAGDGAVNGRYSIEYSKKSILTLVLYVSITQLTRSDSGRYSCGLDRRLFPDSHKEFEIIVKDAPATLKPSWTERPVTSPAPSASTPTPAAQSSSSSSGSFTSPSASPKTTSQCVTERTATPAAHQGKLLSVGLILSVKMLLIFLTVLFFCCRRRGGESEGCRRLE
ncbi:CMRF35-like molecule 9 [Centropristis striata]|uniref:CMRF35-like molecule 9 n=1 Tax=Centropristis striata TaxID=184440 RepID=UPI0027DFBD7A|nr:CMRF35-like molecule 9 [Centropristis striata]